MAIKLSQFASFLSGNEALDRAQKNVALAVDPIVKLLHSWKLALSVDGWLQYDNSDLVDVDSAQALTNKTAANIKDPTRAYAVYTSTAGASFASSATPTIVDFATKVSDSRSAVATGAAWKFTVPTGHGGLYLVGATVTMLGGGAASDNNMYLYKSGSVLRRLGLVALASNGTYGGNALVPLVDGDYIDFRFAQTTGSSRSLTALASDNYCHIVRLVTDL
jgi:hypothetical protein